MDPTMIAAFQLKITNADAAPPGIEGVVFMDLRSGQGPLTTQNMKEVSNLMLIMRLQLKTRTTQKLQPKAP